MPPIPAGRFRPLLVHAIVGLWMCTGAHAASAQACAQGTISEIAFERAKPWGPEATSEDASAGWLFRGLNAVHVRSMPTVLAWELLFEVGDCLDPVLLEESERRLRRLPYIVSAAIETERLADGTNRVLVSTTDAWALSLAVSFTVDQGFQLTGLSLNSRNTVGTGTQFSAFRSEYRERFRLGLLGRQPNFFGTGIDVSLQGGQTRPGHYWSEYLFRPYTGEVGVSAFRQVAESRDDYFPYSVDPALGFTQVYQQFETERFELTYQRRFGSIEGTRFTVGAGASYESVRFPFGSGGVRIVRDNQFGDTEPAPADVVAEVGTQASNHEATRLNLVVGVRNLSFLDMVGLDALRATQDVVEGVDVTFTIAPGVPLGGDQVTDLLLRLQGSVGLLRGDVYLGFLGDAQWRHVYASPGGTPEGWRDLLSELEANAYWDQRPGQQLYVRAHHSAGHQLDRPFQLTVGGREGVRGYTEDAYPAGHRALLTVEQRLTPGWRSAIADVGFALFADAGRGWAGSVPYGEDSGWRAGVGAGIRLALPAGAPNVIRIDVGLPLTGDRESRGTVFRMYSELFGLLDRRGWPTQVERSRWYGTDADLTTRPVNPLAGN